MMLLVDSEDPDQTLAHLMICMKCHPIALVKVLFSIQKY